MGNPSVECTSIWFAEIFSTRLQISARCSSDKALRMAATQNSSGALTLKPLGWANVKPAAAKPVTSNGFSGNGTAYRPLGARKIPPDFVGLCFTDLTGPESSFARPPLRPCLWLFDSFKGTLPTGCIVFLLFNVNARFVVDDCTGERVKVKAILRVVRSIALEVGRSADESYAQALRYPSNTSRALRFVRRVRLVGRVSVLAPLRSRVHRSSLP